jgi:hypothetical protein
MERPLWRPLKSDETEFVPPTGIRKQPIPGELAKAFEVNPLLLVEGDRKRDRLRSLSAQSGRMPNLHGLQINVFQMLRLDALIKLLRYRVRATAGDTGEKISVV